MKTRAITLALCVLAACSPPQQANSESVSRDWSAVGSQYYVIEAEAEGPNCRDATATIRITSRGGEVLFEREYETARVPLAFSPNSNQTALRAELEGWTSACRRRETAGLSAGGRARGV
jgi:hypothetical protein